MSAEERIEPLSLCPEMATLMTGTVNFGQDVFWNSPSQLVEFSKAFQKYHVMPEFEIFDVGMIENAKKLLKDGYFSGHTHFDFVMGVPGAIPAKAEHLIHMVQQLPQDNSWSVAGVGRFQLPMATMGIVLGGHVRVGLEDNIYYVKGKLASNRELVKRITRIAAELQIEVASPDEARCILGLTEKAACESH
jgi:3-keto-5-aminohexanoate cleavage enzyme